jgi:endonuclease/exonuclease/phosphatase family metal-dependent hydrolase
MTMTSATPPAAVPTTDAPTGEPVRRLASRAVAALCWAYLALAVAAWAVLRFAAGTWWPATLLALGPRWVLATPLALLVPLALLGRRRSRAVLAVAAVVVVGPVMDLCLPWRRLLPASAGPRLRVLTCNVHGPTVDRPALAALIATAQPDVVAFEEWDGRPFGGESNPTRLTAIPGWYWQAELEIRIESRYPVRKVADVVTNGWSAGAAIRYEVATPAGPVPVIVAHLKSPHDVIRAVLRQKGKESAGVRDNAAAREDQAMDVGDAARAAGPAVVCLGDLNLPTDAPAFRDGFAGLTDAFATGGLGFGSTYRVRWTTTRIDHVLTGPAWRCRHCWVGPDVGSPHRPLLADLERISG